MAHVFEMTDRPDAGVHWMHEHVDCWATDTVVATHCWWHLALFHLAQGQVGRALSLYDLRVRAGRSLAVADLIDAAALLWRIEMDGSGGDTKARWDELASAWAPHIADGFCTFNDIHAMIAFVGARDWDLARRLESELVRRKSRRRVTARRRARRAARVPRTDRVRPRPLHPRDRSAGAPAGAEHAIGGSHAQRDVLHLTLVRAVERIRRPLIAA